MNIDEITYASGIQSIGPHLDISNSELIGPVENLEVYEQDLDNGTCYFLFDSENKKYLSYIATDSKIVNSHLHLNQIENISGVKGSLSTLLFFLTKKKKFKFYIDKEDPLTGDGLGWVISTLSSGRKLFDFTDQTGKLPNIDSLKKEWEDSRIDSDHRGKISIFIESVNGDRYNRIFENTSGLLKPMYRIFMDKDLD